MNLNLIKHPEFGTIRTELINGDIWFCGQDVCEILGYENTRDALIRHCRQGGVVKHDVGVETGLKRDGTPAIQVVNMKFINEGNLYRLIMSSRLPSAERFESWVCDDVLPELRRNGYYGFNKRGLKRGGEQPEVMRLLSVVNNFLLHGDKKSVGKEIGVSQQAINSVLLGYNRSPRILGALYERALKNSADLGRKLYITPEKAMEKLIKI